VTSDTDNAYIRAWALNSSHEFGYCPPFFQFISGVSIYVDITNCHQCDFLTRITNFTGSFDCQTVAARDILNATPVGVGPCATLSVANTPNVCPTIFFSGCNYSQLYTRLLSFLNSRIRSASFSSSLRSRLLSTKIMVNTHAVPIRMNPTINGIPTSSTNHV
jgi:hypothetical protein